MLYHIMYYIDLTYHIIITLYLLLHYIYYRLFITYLDVKLIKGKTVNFKSKILGQFACLYQPIRNLQ